MVFSFIVIPLFEIPNDLRTTKIINTSSIISIALAFLSIYLNDLFSEKLENQNKLTTMQSQISDYYLSIIELISEEQAPGTSENKVELTKDDN